MKRYEQGMEDAARTLSHETSGGVPRDSALVNDGHRAVASAVVEEFLRSAGVRLSFNVESAFGSIPLVLWLVQLPTPPNQVGESE